MLFPSLVQSVSGNAVASPVSLTLPAQTRPNSCLVVCSSGNATGNDPQVTGITLGGSADNFAQSVAVGVASTDFALTSIWADPGCAGGQTAVSVTFSSTGTPLICVVVLELSGIFTSAPLDKTASNPQSGVSTFTSTATATTAQPTEVAVGAVGAYNSAAGIGTITGPGNPWVNLAQQNSGGGSFGLLVGYQVLSATGAVTYSGSFAPTGIDCATAVATYKASLFPSAPLLARQAVKRAAHY